MIRKQFKYPAIFFVTGLLMTFQMQAQETKKQTIDITSSFKPELRATPKLNFNASPPAADTARPKLNYTIPVQNILPALQPIALKPLALSIDSASSWPNSNYIKAGFGNLTTPYLKAGFSLGDSRTKFNVFADHISSKGKIDFQDYSQTSFSGNVYTPVAENLELHAKAGFRQDKYFQYGFDKTLFNFPKDDILQRFSTISGGVGLRNLMPTEFGLSYHPDLKISVFADNRSNSESNAVLDLPLEQTIGESFAIRLGLNANLTRLSPDNGDAINNGLYTIPVGVLYRTSGLKINAGVTPAWDNSAFKLLPNIQAEFPVAEEKWIIHAGWISYFDKGSYQRFASVNPYLALPTQLKNTRMVEVFGGFKGILFNKFTYNAKIGGIEYNNLPLFVNDKASGRSFNVIYEEKLRALQVHGEIGFVQAETFSVQAALDLFNFNKQTTELKPYGLIPIEFKTHLRWKIIKDLWFKTDLFLWDGPNYKKQDDTVGKLAGGFDLNAGLEFRITRQLMLWTQFNNITNSKYQRWNQYDNYGFNMLGGITFSFAQ